jgi:hypothetical protein
MILRPSKHSHPDRTVISVSMLVLARLKSRRLEEYDALKKLVKKHVSGGELLFLPAMNLLYLLGLVEYRPKVDAFEYLGRP